MVNLAPIPDELGESIFSQMAALATTTGAVNLGQGFPDGAGPSAMLAAANEAVDAGLNQYAPSIGLKPLREQIAAQRADRYGTRYNPDTETVVTAGATEAITAAVMALCEPGDEVAMFEPYFDSYAAATKMAQATRRAIPLTATPAGFEFDPTVFADALNDRTRVLIFNSPHNPTGKVFTVDEMREIARLCAERDVIIISDEVYEYLTYDDARHVPMATLAPERTVSVSGIGKTFSATGWRVGWACAPEPIVAKIASVKQFLSFTVNTPFQIGATTALRDCLNWVESLRISLQSRRDVLTRALRDAGINVYPTSGSYFLQTDARSFGEEDGMAFCLDIAHKAGVVAVPSVAFYDHVDTGRHLIRLAFCKDEATVKEGAERLIKYHSSR